MTNQQILEKAIQKAIDGGWITMSDEWELRGNGVYWKGDVTEIRQTYPDIIFNHDFAKALWPGHKCTCGVLTKGVSKNGTTWTTRYNRPHLKGCKYADGWRHHLREMVITENPIAYLGENI